MGSSSWGGVSREILMENITLLWLLNREPEKPAENPVPQQLLKETESTSRRLTIERERDLVDNLAFLSASTDDPRKVMAVCVEEDQGTEGLTIRMATNKGDLERVKKGFTRIATILERAAAKNKPDTNSSALLEEVVALSRGRIYSRLRSKHAEPSKRNLDKPPIVLQLADAVSALNTLRIVPRVDLKSLHSQMEELQRLFRQLEDMTEEQANSPRSHETLISLLKSVDSLDSKNDLEKLFSTIPNSGRFGPDVRSSLRASVGKLGRYYSTCNFLIIAARRLPIFRSIRVESARLPMPVSSPLWITQDPTISATLDRILKAQTNRRSQRWAPSIASAETKFRSQLAASPNSYTVHAEIQLLFYYQMHPEIRRPRVICSSKSACFLCDLFVKLHAKFYVARTHGVLYNKWILPDWRTIHLPGEGIKDLTRVVEQLNVTLEDRIRSTLPIPRIPRSHPNESVLIVPALWTPSAVSLASSTGPQVIAGSQHSAGYLKDHPELMANVGAFRSCPPRSTTADQGAVDRGWSSNDRTSSRPALENGGCSDFLTSASSVEVPTVDPEGSLEPRGRQDEIINSDIVRTSPTSQYHFDRPTWASSRSPRSTPRDGFISKLPVRHKMKVDYSEYRNPKSSVSVHHLNTSSPIPCLGVVAPNYEPLIQGIWIERELPTFGPPVKLSTRLIHVTLSYDWAEVTHKLATVERQEKRQESSRSEKGYLVQVKWLGSEEEPRRSSEQRSNIVDLDDMDENLEETLSHGAASSSTELYIHRRFDMIAIKFILEE